MKFWDRIKTEIKAFIFTITFSISAVLGIIILGVIIGFAYISYFVNKFFQSIKMRFTN